MLSTNDHNRDEPRKESARVRHRFIIDSSTQYSPEVQLLMCLCNIFQEISDDYGSSASQATALLLSEMTRDDGDTAVDAQTQIEQGSNIVNNSGVPQQ